MDDQDEAPYSATQLANLPLMMAVAVAGQHRATEGMDTNTWERIRQMHDQFLESRKNAAQGGHGDIEMTDSGGPGAMEQSFRDQAQNLGATREDLEDEQEAPQARPEPLLGATGQAPGEARPGSLLGGQGMAMKGPAGGGRPYHVQMQRSPNPHSPTGYSWAVRQVYDDGRP